MKRILVISPRYPFPSTDGFTVRVGDMCRFIGDHGDFEQHLLIYDSGVGDVGVGGDCFRSVTRCVDPAANVVPTMSARLRRKLMRPHFTDDLFRNAGVLATIAALHDKLSFVTCIVHTPQLYWCLDALPDCVTRIIDAHDIWHHKYQAFESIGAGALVSHFRDPDRELAVYRAVDAVLAISLSDHAYLIQNGISSIYVPVSFVPRHQPSSQRGAHSILYAAGSGPPNVNALRFFIESCLPAIRANVPSVVLKILGAGGEIRRSYADREDIELLPFIDDIVDAYALADIVVVPLQIGTGLKIKVLESFAFGKPTIVSQTAVQGVHIESYAQEVISNEADMITAEVKHAMQSPSYRARLSQSGLEIIRCHYQEDDVYRGLVDRLVTRTKPASS